MVTRKINPGEDSFHEEIPYVKTTNRFVLFVSEQERSGTKGHSNGRHHTQH